MESNELRDVDVKNKKKDWLKTILLLISMLILIIAAYHVIEILLGPVFERQFESPVYESDKVILKTGRAIYDAVDGFIYLFSPYRRSCYFGALLERLLPESIRFI